MSKERLARITVTIIAAFIVLFAAADVTLAQGGPGHPGQPGQPGHPGQPGNHGHHYMIDGVIVDVAADDAGTLRLTIDRGDVDDNPDDDVAVLVPASTKISPPDAALDVGDNVRAMVTGDEEPFEAYHITVLDEAAHEPGHMADRPLHGCGTIASLPEDVHDGWWTIDVPAVDSFKLMVTADTDITPADVAPAEGMNACFKAHSDGEELQADHIQLSAGHGPGSGAKARKLQIRGIVVAPPGDSLPSEIKVAVEGRDDLVAVQVTADTRIQGELDVDASVVIQARVENSETGEKLLVAEKIVVVARHGHRPGHPGRGPGMEPGQGKAAVHFSGIVTAVNGDGDGDVWTIDPGELGGADEFYVLVTAETKLVGFGGTPVGEEVEGVAKPDADGQLVARMIRAE